MCFVVLGRLHNWNFTKKVFTLGIVVSKKKTHNLPPSDDGQTNV